MGGSSLGMSSSPVLTDLTPECLAWLQYYNKDIEAGFEASSLFHPQLAQTPESARKPASKRRREEGMSTRCFLFPVVIRAPRCSVAFWLGSASVRGCQRWSRRIGICMLSVTTSGQNALHAVGMCLIQVHALPTVYLIVRQAMSCRQRAGKAKPGRRNSSRSLSDDDYDPEIESLPDQPLSSTPASACIVQALIAAWLAGGKRLPITD